MTPPTGKGRGGKEGGRRTAAGFLPENNSCAVTSGALPPRWLLGEGGGRRGRTVMAAPGARTGTGTGRAALGRVPPAVAAVPPVPGVGGGGLPVRAAEPSWE